jgi:hypothetical protein
MAKAWEYRKNMSTPQNRYRLMWMDVKYEPGTVKWWLLMTMLSLKQESAYCWQALPNSLDRQENN